MNTTYAPGVPKVLEDGYGIKRLKIIDRLLNGNMI